MERAIHISSIDREKTGENRPDNFLIKFNPPLNLNPDMKHSRLILGIMSEAVTNIIPSNIQTTEELIGILSLSKMECIRILISMITFDSIWNKKNIIQQIHKVIKNFILISILFYQPIEC